MGRRPNADCCGAGWSVETDGWVEAAMKTAWDSREGVRGAVAGGTGVPEVGLVRRARLPADRVARRGVGLATLSG